MIAKHQRNYPVVSVAQCVYFKVRGMKCVGRCNNYFFFVQCVKDKRNNSDYDGKESAVIK